MAGIGIGILDALPIFGTGTVLLPWAVWSAVTGEWRQAGILAALYAVCYFVRQILEARMMGGQVGLSSLETLAAVYVGLELFGFFGSDFGAPGASSDRRSDRRGGRERSIQMPLPPLTNRIFWRKINNTNQSEYRNTAQKGSSKSRARRRERGEGGSPLRRPGSNPPRSSV